MTGVEVSADKIEVFDVMEHLKKSFLEYVTENNIKPINGFMAAHNFHKLVVMNLAIEMNKEEKIAFYNMAKDTWDKALTKLILEE